MFAWEGQPRCIVCHRHPDPDTAAIPASSRFSNEPPIESKHSTPLCELCPHSELSGPATAHPAPSAIIMTRPPPTLTHHHSTRHPTPTAPSPSPPHSPYASLIRARSSHRTHFIIS
ncbi:uncharacterized protein CC84DRAFT_1204696 [Paraphaeosphaeria sporulosa]|uniref:Uncharacterized protein n=1 Tax=Paraphaeosphaeria sporulosa TaxID=1460663 RepID=A0A177CHT8_9PLEO|nr:uncharacterized protein CC84DRAFT_1204696 [Paraphaeosphaeria sporulosa]OAG07104.1 hypothetical protein CC84DRAFT_1204696 [Paraphaeosphaeria sporulosa]